jgi:hypothetical protein
VNEDAMAAPKEALQITVPTLNLQLMHIRIVGDSPLICHAWSGKAKKAMLDKQMKRGKQKKEAKDPEADFEESLYPMPGGGYGFPAVAFKSAMVGACRFAEGVKMTEARGAFHIIGEIIPIEGEATPREDMVRVGMGTADIRYRGEFKQWSAILPIQFNANVVSAEQIINLLTLAGFGVGVGEWRPERNGSYGRFHVATENAT